MFRGQKLVVALVHIPIWQSYALCLYVSHNLLHVGLLVEFVVPHVLWAELHLSNLPTVLLDQLLLPQPQSRRVVLWDVNLPSRSQLTHVAQHGILELFVVLCLYQLAHKSNRPLLYAGFAELHDYLPNQLMVVDEIDRDVL